MTNVLTAPLKVLDITGDPLAGELNSVRVHYVPEGQGRPGAAELMDWFDRTMRFNALEASEKAAQRIGSCRPVLRDIVPASRCVPGMRDGLILHAGPPVSSFDELGEGLQKAVVGAAVHEGLAFDNTEATEKLRNGTIKLECTEDHRCAAAGCGAVSGSMYMFCITDPVSGCWAYAPVTAIGGARISDGRDDKEAVDALIYTEDTIAPVFQKMIVSHGDLDIFSVCAGGLQCGDDGCVRLEAASMLFMKEFLPLVCAQVAPSMLTEFISYLSDSSLFAQLLAGAQRCCIMSTEENRDCTLFANASSNGRKIGVRPFGSSEWITADLPEGFSCGDELIGELFGMGSAFLAGAPMLLKEIRMGERDALELLYDAFEVSSGHIHGLPIPYAGGKGSPSSPDYSYMVRTGKGMKFLSRRNGECAIMDCGADLPIRALERYRDSHQDPEN